MLRHPCFSLLMQSYKKLLSFELILNIAHSSSFFFLSWVFKKKYHWLLIYYIMYFLGDQRWERMVPHNLRPLMLGFIIITNITCAFKTLSSSLSGCSIIKATVCRIKKKDMWLKWLSHNLKKIKPIKTELFKVHWCVLTQWTKDFTYLGELSCCGWACILV